MAECNNTTIICIDIQEKLVKIASDEIKNNIIKLMKAASILDIDTIVTEQYPKGLGETIGEIKSIKNFKTIEKTTFSALRTPEFPKKFNENVVIFGIETHICVWQSVLDLIEKGYNVYVPCDCCASRSEENKKTALENLKQKGANIVTLEMLLFDFLKSSNHPNFKEIQGLIK